MPGLYDHLIGELQPGDTGWLPLDESGEPTGPATLEPPPPLGSLACSVLANPVDPLGPDDHALLSSTGAPLDPPLVSNVDRRVTPGEPIEPPEPPVEMLTPTLYSLTPPKVKQNVAPFWLTLTGTNFYPESMVSFGGNIIPHTYLSAEQVRISIDPAQYTIGSYSVYVDNDGSTSSGLIFKIETPLAESRSRR